jgi:hypothetical protein
MMTVMVSSNLCDYFSFDDLRPFSVAQRVRKPAEEQQREARLHDLSAHHRAAASNAVDHVQPPLNNVHA